MKRDLSLINFQYLVQVCGISKPVPLLAKALLIVPDEMACIFPISEIHDANVTGMGLSQSWVSVNVRTYALYTDG